MRPPDQADDSELELTPLDTQRGRRLLTGPTWRGVRGRRWRVALAICAIALAIIAPLASLPPTRAAIARIFPTPTPRPTAVMSAAVSIIGVSNNPTIGIAPAEWSNLRARPLRLPTIAPGAACPGSPGRVVQPSFGMASGDGPAYIVGLGTDGAVQATGPGPIPNGRGSATWGAEFVMFIIAPSYQGAVLARGGQIDGQHALLFNGGLDQLNGFDQSTTTLLSQLRLASAPAYGEPWPNFPAYLRMQAPGCYAIQLDGDTFSEVVVFNITFGQ
ncbi:MAG TPA: hypothetical protein VF739_06500 [Ktedonobacterales bacterium]